MSEVTLYINMGLGCGGWNTFWVKDSEFVFEKERAVFFSNNR